MRKLLPKLQRFPPNRPDNTPKVVGALALEGETGDRLPATLCLIAVLRTKQTERRLDSVPQPVQLGLGSLMFE